MIVIILLRLDRLFPLLLREAASLPALECWLAFLPQHGGIAAGLGEVELHGFVEELEAVDFFDGVRGGGAGVEDDEGLPFGFQVRFGDQVDDGAVFGEDFAEGGFECVRFDALF